VRLRIFVQFHQSFLSIVRKQFWQSSLARGSGDAHDIPGIRTCPGNRNVKRKWAVESGGPSCYLSVIEECTKTSEPGHPVRAGSRQDREPDHLRCNASR